MSLSAARFKLLPLLLLLVLIVTHQGAAADDNGIPDKFIADIEKLLEVTGAGKVGAGVGSAIADYMIDAMREQKPEIPQELVDVIRDEISILVAEEMPKLIKEIVPIYTRHLTHEDVRGLLAFYDTPLGKKSIAAMPLIMQESMLAGQLWGQRLTPMVETRLQQRLSKEGFGDQL